MGALGINMNMSKCMLVFVGLQYTTKKFSPAYRAYHHVTIRLIDYITQPSECHLSSWAVVSCQAPVLT